MSCSWAWRDFFTPQPQLLDHLMDSTPADAHAVAGQSLAQLRQGEVRLLGQPLPQLLAALFVNPAHGTMPQLCRPLHLSCPSLLNPNLFAVSPTHTKLRCQFAQAASARRISLQELATQIIRIGLWRAFVAAEIATSNIPQLYPTGYDYYGTALVDTSAVVIGRGEAIT